MKITWSITMRLQRIIFVVLFLVIGLSTYFPQSNKIEDLTNLNKLVSPTIMDKINSGLWEQGAIKYPDKLTNSNQVFSANGLVDSAIVIVAEGTKYKYTYIYNSNMRKTYELIQKWDGSKWIDDRKWEYDYDSNGKLKGYVYQWWDGSSWNNLEKWTFTYDPNGYRATELWEEWDGSEWIGSRRWNYTYGSDGKLLSYYNEWWNYGEWENAYKYTYAWNSQDQTTSILEERWDYTEWVNYTKYTYTYHANGKRSTELYETWEDDAWVGHTRWTLTYDGSGNLTMTLTVNFWNNVWTNDNRDTYGYNTDGNLTMRLWEAWFNGKWDKVRKWTYNYNPLGKMSSLLVEKWEGSSWQNYERKSYSYSDEGNMVAGTADKWEGGNWLPANGYFGISSFGNHYGYSGKDVSIYYQNALIVNSTGDDSDNDLNDNKCWTGKYITRNGVQELEITLRAAIETINFRHSFKTIPIIFDLPDGIQPIINLESYLPTIESPLSIDGTLPNGKNIEISGQKTKGLYEADGIKINTDNVTLRGLTIHSFPEFGIYIMDGSNHKIVGNKIGFDSEGKNLYLNEKGGIKIEGEVQKCTIGGLDNDSDINHIGGGILLVGKEVARIKILKNVLEIPDNMDRILIDLSINHEGNWDGPTISSWSKEEEGPNKLIAPPRILSISQKKITGITKSLSTVILYDVIERSTLHKRYFPRKVVPITDWPVNFEGYFEIPVDLESFTELVISVIDKEGNSSELSQLRRPVIFLPSVAGSWLTDKKGENLWIPMESIQDNDEKWNERLSRLKMNNKGHDISGVRAERVLEEFYSADRAYGQFLSTMEQLLPGNIDNSEQAKIDLWRMPYDWRRGPFELADSLKKFIDQITGNDKISAWSREVDIVAHGMGGIVTSTYIRKYPEHSQKHLHRLITIGTPYLGTPQAAALHTRGYLFGLDEKRVFIRAFKPDWNVILDMFKNFPSAYSLLPSRAYFQTWEFMYYLENFERNTLWNWRSTAEFLLSAKAGGGIGRSGFDRNIDLFADEQNIVHDFIDDWRSWNGPPQIFRMFGRTNGYTAVKWHVEKPTSINSYISWLSWLNRSGRKENNDLDTQIEYRNWMQPVLGLGDGMVVLESATLGRIPGNAGEGFHGTDFSGVDESSWIEEFEEFPCRHLDLVSGNCQDFEDNFLDYRVLEILLSGYRVVETSTKSTTISKSNAVDKNQEIFYVSGTAPISVVLANENGDFTGPGSLDSIESINYGLAEVGYWATEFSVTVSIPSNKEYTLTVTAPYDSTYVNTSRLVVHESSRDNLLFHEQLISKNGQLRFNLNAGGTPLSTAFDVDVDGDENFETTLAPAAQLESNSLAPAIPYPKPYMLQAEILKSSQTNAMTTLHLPKVGGPVWQWELSDFSSWVQPSQTSGNTPEEVLLTLQHESLAPGIYLDTLKLRLGIQNYTTESYVIIQFVVREEAATLTKIEIEPSEIILVPDESQHFTAIGFDQIGLPMSFKPTWDATGGTIDTMGIYTAGNLTGSYIVTARQGNIEGEVGIQITSTTDISQLYEGIPKIFFLRQNYPNPFNPTTKVIYGLPKSSYIRIDLFNSIGEIVEVLIDANKSAGYHTLDINGNNLSSGIYFMRIKAADFIDTKKIMLIK